jgi:hypothetical protein
MEETDMKETDKVSISLMNMGTVNKNKVIISRGNREVRLYFSYETLVAVDGIVSQNDWSMTTGKLLNELELNKKVRVPHSQVLEEADKRIKRVLYG